MKPLPLDVSLEAGEQRDIEGIVVLLFEMDAYYGDEPSETPSERERQTLRWLTDKDHSIRVVVARYKDAVIGMSCASILWPALGSTPSLFLKELYVANAWRNKGIGSHLMRDAIKFARDQGCSRVEWTALRQDVKAHRFYERLGAEPQDKIVFRLDPHTFSAE